MNSRLRPLYWLFSAAMMIALPMGLAHAQPDPDVDEEVPADINEEPGDDSGDDAMGGDESGGDESGGDVSGGDATGGDGAKAETAAAGGALAGYKKGFFIKSGDGTFELKTKLRFEGRFNMEYRKDEDPSLANMNFRSNRTRVTFAGRAFTKWGYKMQLAWDKGGMVLKDAFADYKASDTLMIRTGLAKQPFSRQHIASSAKLTLVDRAITHGPSGSRRDLGITVHNNYEKSPDLEWAVGIYNAQKADALVADFDPDTGVGNFINYPAKLGPSLVARVGINRGKDAKGKPLKGYSEGDLEGGPLRFGVAANVVADLDLADSDNQTRNIYGGLDYIVKVNGISSTGGFYLHQVEGGDGLQMFGFHLQGSMVMAKTHLLAARFAMVSNADPAGGDRINVIETAVGHTYYFKGHNYKWQTDLTIRDAGGGFGDRVGVRSQFELMF